MLNNVLHIQKMKPQIDTPEIGSNSVGNSSRILFLSVRNSSIFFIFSFDEYDTLTPLRSDKQRIVVNVP